MASEADIQDAIVEALLYDGWLILRVNHGQSQRPGERSWEIYWQHLGIDQQRAGIADVIAVKEYRLTMKITGDIPSEKVTRFSRILAIEVKAPGKKKNVTDMQLAFLKAIEEHGGIGIVADSLEDLKPYLDRVEVQ